MISQGQIPAYHQLLLHFHASGNAPDSITDFQVLAPETFSLLH